MTSVGDKAVCIVCGGVVVAIKDPTVISLTAGRWIHVSRLRRLVGSHAPRVAS